MSQGQDRRKTVLVVGNCLPDNFTVGRWFKKHFDVEFVKARNRKATIKILDRDSFDLVLVNRVFDSDGGDGLELISELIRLRPNGPVMLLSNFPDSQAEAEQLGAVPGFGKAELKKADSISKMKRVLGSIV